LSPPTTREEKRREEKKAVRSGQVAAAGMGRGGGMGNPVNVGIAVQADWENREFISNISLNVRRLFDFLLRFGQLDLRPATFSSPRFHRICCRVLTFTRCLA
jgi:hypothetical protein